jgi:ankyrin repeat protein
MLRKKDLEAVQLLLGHGADPNARQEYSWTALHLAAYYGHCRVAEILLQRGADPHARTGLNKTSFQLALEENHALTAGLLSEPTREGMKVI